MPYQHYFTESEIPAMSILGGVRHPLVAFNEQSRPRKFGILSLLGACLAALAFLVMPTTGAWQSFSLPDTELHGTGAVMSGTSNDVQSFTFDKIQPGPEGQKQHEYTVTNNGNVAAGAWLVNKNETALSTLNNLGTYGYFKVEVTQGGVTKKVFESYNLNDRAATCGAFGPAGCNPVPDQIMLDASLNPGHTIKVTITVGYASKMVNVPPTWNKFPLPGPAWSPANPNGQTYVNHTDGTGDGLRQGVVLMQINHEPLASSPVGVNYCADTASAC